MINTVLVERLSGSFHCTDLEFSLFDALFDGVIFKIDILNFFKICPFILNALGRTVANEITDSIRQQNAAQLLWSSSRVHFHCATINVHGSVTQLSCEMHFQLCNRLYIT